MNKTQWLQTCLPSRCVSSVIWAWKENVTCYRQAVKRLHPEHILCCSNDSLYSFVCVFTGFVRDYDNGPMIANPPNSNRQADFPGNTSATKLQRTAL